MSEWVSIDVQKVRAITRDLHRHARAANEPTSLPSGGFADPAAAAVGAALSDLIAAERAATEFVVATTARMAGTLDELVPAVQEADRFSLGMAR